MSRAHVHLNQLPISRVSLIGADSTSVTELVQCPRSASSVPLACCTGCVHCEAVTRGREGAPGAVVCALKPDQALPAELCLPRLDVADVMVRDVLCVRSTLSLDAALMLFLEHGLRTIPVVDDENHLLGMLHEPDLQLAIQTGRGVAEGTVANVMMPVALAVPEAMPVTRAAAIMAFEGVSSLVVLSSKGAIVGLLAASDLLLWLARADGYLTRVRRSDIP